MDSNTPTSPPTSIEGKKSNAGFSTFGSLKLRQQFGAVLDYMRGGGEPIIIEKNSEPVAVIMSYELFKQKFIELQTDDEKNQLLERFLTARKPYQQDSTTLVQELRNRVKS